MDLRKRMERGEGVRILKRNENTLKGDKSVRNVRLPSEKWLTPKLKNLPPLGTNSFFLE